MPHKRPPSKTKKDSNDLVKMMLLKNFLKKGIFSDQDEEMTYQSVGMDNDVEVVAVNEEVDQNGGRYYPQTGGEMEEIGEMEGINHGENEDELEMNSNQNGPDYVFLGASYGGSVGPLTEPQLVTQLRELRRRIQQQPVVQLGGADLQDFLKIHRELDSAISVSREACGQLTRFAKENILGLAKELKNEISYQQLGHQTLSRTYDLNRVDQFLDKYENFNGLCQSDFKEIYKEVKNLRSEMESDLTKNDFKSNNQKIGELLGMGRGGGLFGFGSRFDSQSAGKQLGGASRTEINQLLRANQRQLDDRGEQMLGGGIVSEFRKLQLEAQKRMSIGLGDHDNGRGMLGGRRVGMDDEQSLFGENVGSLSPAEREAKFQYIDAKKKLLEKQAELLAIKQEKLKSHERMFS